MCSLISVYTQIMKERDRFCNKEEEKYLTAFSLFYEYPSYARLIYSKTMILVTRFYPTFLIRAIIKEKLHHTFISTCAPFSLIELEDKFVESFIYSARKHRFIKTPYIRVKALLNDGSIEDVLIRKNTQFPIKNTIENPNSKFKQFLLDYKDILLWKKYLFFYKEKY